MKDEIKEILNYLKDENEYYDESEQVTVDYGEIILEKEDIDKLLDYITNLQEEIQKKEAMYDSLAVSYRLEQEENERLNNIINKTTKLLKQAGSYDEETKQFCDDVWEELPDILNTLEGSNK